MGFPRRARGGRRLSQDASGSARRGLVPLAATLAYLAAGLVFSFGNLGLPGQAPGWWFMPTDLWATWHNAQFVSWGRLGQVYAAHTQLMALPGLAIVLAPLAWLADHAHLASGWPSETAHPGAWVLADPAALLLGSSVLWALDRWARRLGLSTTERAALAAVEAAVAFVAVAPMGHPEDLVSVAFVLYAMEQAQAGQVRRAGWLAGVALSMQQLAALGGGVLAALAMAGTKGKDAKAALAPMALRAAVVPGAIAAWCLISAPAATWAHLVAGHSSNPWPTPLAALAPAGDAGPLRMVELVGAALAGLGLWRSDRSGVQIAWWMGIAFSVRVLEPLQTPYYLTPAMAAFVLAAFASRRPVRRIVASAAAIGIGVATGPFQEGHPWSLWLTILAFTATAAAASVPPRSRSQPSQGDERSLAVAGDRAGT